MQRAANPFLIDSLPFQVLFHSPYVISAAKKQRSLLNTATVISPFSCTFRHFRQPKSCTSSQHHNHNQPLFHAPFVLKATQLESPTHWLPCARIWYRIWCLYSHFFEMRSTVKEREAEAVQKTLPLPTTRNGKESEPAQPEWLQFVPNSVAKAVCLNSEQRFPTPARLPQQLASSRCAVEDHALHPPV